jgi:hypothetical protein
LDKPTITFVFPEEAANKVKSYTGTTGEAEWNNILRGFESVLGCLPVEIKTAGIPGNVSLPTKVHAGR